MLLQKHPKNFMCKRDNKMKTKSFLKMKGCRHFCSGEESPHCKNIFQDTTTTQRNGGSAEAGYEIGNRKVFVVRLIFLTPRATSGSVLFQTCYCL